MYAEEPGGEARKRCLRGNSEGRACQEGLTGALDLWMPTLGGTSWAPSLEAVPALAAGTLPGGGNIGPKQAKRLWLAEGQAGDVVEGPSGQPRGP